MSAASPLIAPSAAAASAAAELNRQLRRWRIRQQLARTVRWLPRALLIACGLASALAISARLRPWLSREDLLSASALLLCAGASVALFRLWLWPRPALRVARQLERALGLRERFSTALELRAGAIRTRPRLAEYQLRDAIVQSVAIPAAALPIRPALRELLLLAIALISLLLLILLPNPQDAARRAQRMSQRQFSAASAALAELRNALLSDEALGAEQRRRLLRAIDEAAAPLADDRVSREEAVASLYDAARQLEAGDAESGLRAAAAQQAIREADAALRRAERRPAPERPTTLSESLRRMRDELLNLSVEERARLAGALREAAEAFASEFPELADALESAALALEEGDMAAAESALADAILQLQELEAQQQRSVAEHNAMERTTEQLRDSADQLAGGDEEPMDAAEQPGNETGDPSSAAGDPSSFSDDPTGLTREGRVAGGDGADEASDEAPGGNDSSGQVAGAGDVTSGQRGDVSGSASKDAASASNQPDGAGRGQYETLYAPLERMDSPSEIGIELEAGSSQTLLDTGEFSDNPPGESRLPYTQLYQSYRDTANSALETEYIPLALRAVIHSYFSALAPADETLP